MEQQLCPVCSLQAPLKCSSCRGVSYCSVAHQKVHWKIHKETCSSYTIVNGDSFGQSCVATKDLEAGTVILMEKPILYAPCWDESLGIIGPVCVTCGKLKPLEPIRRCSSCSWPVCSEECEKNSSHAENECRVFADKKFRFPPPKISPDDFMLLIMMVRALMLQKKDLKMFSKIQELERIPDFVYGFSFDPEKIAAHVVVDVVYSLMFQNLASKHIQQVIFEKQHLNKLLRIVILNNRSRIPSVAGETREGINSKIYLYIKASRLNHSCVPNCFMTINHDTDYRIRVVTAVPVKKGEALTLNCIPAVTPYSGTLERQKATEAKGFPCKCTRCTDPTELGTYMSAVTCKDCKGTDASLVGYMVPNDPLDFNYCSAKWRCNRCDAFELASDISLKVEQIWNAVSKEANELASKMDLSPMISFNKKIVDKYSGKILHPNHWILQRATQIVIDFLECHGLTDPEICDYCIKSGKYLLAIQDIVSPGHTEARATLKDQLLRILQVKIVGHVTPVMKEIAGMLELYKDYSATTLLTRTYLDNGRSPAGESVMNRLETLARVKDMYHRWLFPDCENKVTGVVEN